MYTYKIGIDKKTHDDFVKDSNLTNLLQSSSWADVKDNWGHELIGFFDGDKQVASASILIKKLPLGYTMLYTPRGPIMDYTNEALVQFVLNTLKDYGKTKKALFVKIDPNILLQSIEPNGEIVVNPSADKIIKNIQSTGAIWSGKTTDMAATIQPRFNAVIYQDNFGEDLFDKKTRQFIRKAKKSAPIIQNDKDELIEDFASLMKKTEERKEVSLRNADYYKKLLDIYPDSFINLVSIDFDQLLQEAQETLDKANTALENNESTNSKRLTKLENDLAAAKKNLDHISSIIANEGKSLVPVAGTLTVSFGDSAETLYAGTDTSYNRYYPSYLTWFSGTEHAFDLENKTLNMGGLENSLSDSDGLLKFKKHFNPTIEETIGEFDIPVNKVLFKASETAYKLRKKLRSKN